MSFMTPQELKQKLDEGQKIFVLDVREPLEYEEWHIPGSVNIPLSSVYAGAELPKDRKIIAVCLHGMRSERAKQILSMQGYDISSMRGGMVAWNSVYDITEISSGILQIRRVGKGCLSYMITSDGEAAVIDPTIDTDVYMQAAGKNRIAAAIETHVHADHASGGCILAERTGAAYYAPDDGQTTKHQTVSYGTAIRVGDAEIRAVHTPGHTPGSMTYLLGEFAFTGDTLFIESVGRPDLGQDAEENAGILWETLQKRILVLPDTTKILPAHYGSEIKHGLLISAALGELKRSLAALSMQKQKFIRWVAGNVQPKPSNFEAIKEFNKGLAELEDEELRELEAGPNRCAVR
ncbi:MAG: MBL fold metallo-hydrolase [Candidatus Aenigmarchaeota archaeon]|nr:MBL fold metallo-hydrolase [Candidatus Aenigmarchaeota archaeon]